MAPEPSASWSKGLSPPYGHGAFPSHNPILVILIFSDVEKLYQYLWNSRMFGRKLIDSEGRTLEVIDPGQLNTNSGPDFFNSKIKADGTEWAGNIEIHVRASDWFRHGHHNDPAYDNILLHVVGVSDQRIRRKDGSIIPQVVLTMPEDFYRTLSLLQSEAPVIRCAQALSSLSRINVTDWLESLSIERLQMKGNKIKDTYTNCGNDWQQTCFVTLARALGFGLNGDPFEMLARSIPLKILHHHSDSPHQLQALLFGQAAMLDSSLHIFDEYYQLLCREYYFLAKKYGLRPMRQGLWKYARTRPQNFPHRRIAFLSKACEGGFSLFSKILATKGKEEEARTLFNWELEGYWHSHFSFDMECKATADTLSRSSITLLLINVVAPILYTYGAMRGDPDLAERGLDLLSELPAEINTITRDWQNYGITAKDALRSQALIQLRKEYCNTRKCLSCRFGHQLLRRSANTSALY